MRVYLSQAGDMLESKLSNAPESVNLKSLFPMPGTEAALQKCLSFFGVSHPFSLAPFASSLS